MKSFSKIQDKRIGVLVGLKRINDLDLIDDSRVFSEIGFKETDRNLVSRIAELISILYDEFDYFNSNDFQKSIQGKSPSFIAMKKKLLTPARLREKRLEFSRELEKLPGSLIAACELSPTSQHSLLRELCELIDHLSQECANQDPVETF